MTRDGFAGVRAWWYALRVHRHDYDDVRLRNFADEVLAPAAFVARSTLEVSVWQTHDRVGIDQARDADYRSVEPGWRWGPAWSSAWFRLHGAMPAGTGTPALRFSSGTEALLWRAGAPFHGLDANHDLVVLPGAEGAVEMLVEAACNLPLGVSTFWWDEQEVQARWREDTPGRFEYAQLVLVDEEMLALVRRWSFARLLVQALGRDDVVAQRLADALHAAMRAVPDADPRAGAHDAMEVLGSALSEGAPGTCEVTAVGHAHIDTAWLWPLAETRRKCTRTFATMLRLMERRPEFTFLCSQAQQYAWMQEDHPALFMQIADRVSQGRWEAGGGMWIEPDCLVPSGESLIRQALHGSAWWKTHLGVDQSFLYLPDTFGFPASLPQIARQTGLDTFITNKIAWNEVNDFPWVTFNWRGIDGTELVSHMTPGHNYNSLIEPRDLLAAQRVLVERDHGRVGAWLHPFGFGDGGGGPTETQVDRVIDSAAAPSLPRTTFGRADEFCRILHDQESLPVWDGELYLEMHRGIYTSQAGLKARNCALEEALREAELVAPTPSVLDGHWKTLLLHQFHDILPGSSIEVVNVEARAALDEAIDEVSSLVASNRGDGEAVFNPASTPQSGVVSTSRGHQWADGIPPLASALPSDRLPSSVRPVSVDGPMLDNGIIQARVDQFGSIDLLRSVETAIPVGATTGDAVGPLNTLVMFEDRPRQWDAWNLDKDYEDKPVPIGGEPDVSIVEDGPMRGVIEVQRAIGARSGITMRYVLDAGARRLDVHAEIEWAERHRVLQVRFPTGVRARTATYGIQFGCIERPTHRNTSWDSAMFEVPGHRWVDLSEPGRGLAVLDRAIYGKRVFGGELGLTLLRSSAFPDATADLGTHTLHWALMPHGGDWRAAGVDAEAERLVRRLRGGSALVQPPCSIEAIGPVAVEVVACKPAEDGRGRILRLVEKHGGHGTAVLRFPAGTGEIVSCSALEQPDDVTPLVRDGDTLRVGLRPFGIVTVRIEYRA